MPSLASESPDKARATLPPTPGCGKPLLRRLRSLTPGVAATTESLLPCGVVKHAESDALWATLIGAVVGGSLAIAGGLIAQVWRDEREARAAARAIAVELGAHSARWWGWINNNVTTRAELDLDIVSTTVFRDISVGDWVMQQSVERLLGGRRLNTQPSAWSGSDRVGGAPP